MPAPAGSSSDLGSAPSPRGHRAPAGEGDRLRVALLDAAEEELVAKGAGGLSLRKVAGACGVSPTSVYLHFDNKEALLIGVCTRRFEVLQERLDEAMAGADGTLDKILACGEAYLHFALENPELYAAYFGVIPLEDLLEVVPFEEVAGFKALADLAELVEVGIAEGTLRRDDPGQMAMALWGAVHGAAAVIHYTRPIATATQDEQIQAMLRLLLDGLLARPD